jgi:hypothetical protein
MAQNLHVLSYRDTSPSLSSYSWRIDQVGNSHYQGTAPDVRPCHGLQYLRHVLNTRGDLLQASSPCDIAFRYSANVHNLRDDNILLGETRD